MKGNSTLIQIKFETLITYLPGLSRKTSISALLTMPKPLTVQISINCGKSSRSGNARPPYLPPREIRMEVKKQQLELDME